MSTVSFIVIYARDVDKTLQFYSALGLTFLPEQHGAGPKHHSCQMGDLALEIYPSDAKALVGGAGMIGISVTDLDETLLSLQAAGSYVASPIAPFGDGRRCIINDPDGWKVFVYDQTQISETKP